MKTLNFLCVTAWLFCFFVEASVQLDRVDNQLTEVLVFIMLDSLELAPELKRGASVQQCNIRSQRLKTTLETVKANSIAKEFPDWQEADGIAFNDIGQRVKNQIV